MAQRSEPFVSSVGRYSVNLAYLDVITRFQGWQYFVTLTHRRDEDGSSIVSFPVTLYFRQCASILRVPFPRLVWALRREQGERFGRGHYHALIAGTGGGAMKPSIGTGHRLRHAWYKLRFGGFAKARLFDPAGDDVVPYMLKRLGYGDAEGANRYELSKFASDGSEIILSDSLVRIMGGGRTCSHIRSTLDGGEVNQRSEGIVTVGSASSALSVRRSGMASSAEKMVRCEAAKEHNEIKVRWWFPIKPEVLRVHTVERTPMASGFGVEVWGDGLLRHKGLTPAQLLMLKEAELANSSTVARPECPKAPFAETTDSRKLTR